MKRICIAALYIVLVLAACTPSNSVPQATTSEKVAQSAPESGPGESSLDETTQSALEPAPDVTPAENRVAAMTPANAERIRERKTENQNVVGWLTVPGTDIDSVIVQAPEGDNGFYTSHDFAGNPSKDGVFFADNRADFTLPSREGISQNIALNGHSWDENPDGRLFAQLKRFKDQGFAEAHPYIFFSTEAEDMVYEVFAVYYATVNQPYIIPDLPWASLSEVLNLAYEASLYDYGIRLAETDKILTLNTCAFEPPGREPLPLDRIPDYRFVVMARLVSPDEAQKETADVTANSAPITPDAMPVIYSQYADAIQYNGTLYDNLARSHSDKIPEIDPENLIPVGKVERSNVMRDLQDFDATSLAEGTPLFRLESHENLLVAKLGEEMLVYGFGM